MMSLMVWTYIAYLIISIGLTIWVAQTLHKNGRAFLEHCFTGHQALADSVNHLLVVGFYLINIGYITLALKSTDTLLLLQECIELLSGKIGAVLVVLGLLHFSNLFLFMTIRWVGESRKKQPLTDEAQFV